MPAASLLCESMHALADGTHHGRGHLRMLEELSLREPVVGDGQLGPDILEFVRFKEKWEGLTDGVLTYRLVQTVRLEVFLNVKDSNRLKVSVFHLHDLCPEHGRLVFLCAVAVVVDTVVLEALRLVVARAAASPEEAAQLSL